MKAFFAGGLLGLLSLPLPAEAAESGSVCIPRMPGAAPPGREVMTMSGIPPGSTLTVRIDHGSPVFVSPEAGARVDHVALGQRHLLRIARGGDDRTLVSFWFDFRREGASNLCLWYYEGYGTFSLRRARDCACP